MTLSVTDGRVALVLREMADIWSRQNDAYDLLFRDMNSMFKGSESLQISASPQFTVNEGTTGTADSVTNACLTLLCDRPVSMFITLPQLSQLQNMGGGSSISFNSAPSIPSNPWVEGTLRDALTQLRNRISEIAVYYIARSLCWTSAAATYYNNVESDTLTENDVLSCIAELESLDGEHDIAIVAHPMGLASFMAIPGWMPYTQGANVGFGMPQVGSINGVPVFKTNNIQRGIPAGYVSVSAAPVGTPATKSVATVAASVSGAYTLTVPSGHGFVLGEYVYAPNLDNPITEANAAPLTTATATSIVCTSGTATDADELTAGTYSGLVVPRGIKNLVVDRAHMFRCQQLMPSVKIADKGTGQTDDELKITARFGVIGRTGRARVLMTPKTNL
jgi:hypothetical protein